MLRSNFLRIVGLPRVAAKNGNSARTVLFCLAILIIAGCERAPSNNKVTTSQPRPTEPATKPTPAVEFAPASQPATASAPAPVDEKPAYIDIVERRDAARSANVMVEVKDRNWLIISTQNVRRMDIRNESLPIEGAGSIVLRIDGKVIEWLRKQPSIELERSPNNEWFVPEPRKP